MAGIFVWLYVEKGDGALTMSKIKLQLPRALQQATKDITQQFTQSYQTHYKDAAALGHHSDSEFELENSTWASIALLAAQAVENELTGESGQNKKRALFAMLDDIAEQTKSSYDSMLIDVIVDMVCAATKGAININIPKGFFKKCFTCCCPKKKLKDSAVVAATVPAAPVEIELKDAGLPANPSGAVAPAPVSV